MVKEDTDYFSDRRNFNSEMSKQLNNSTGVPVSFIDSSIVNPAFGDGAVGKTYIMERNKVNRECIVIRIFPIITRSQLIREV